jgi:hypothetical protein
MSLSGETLPIVSKGNNKIYVSMKASPSKENLAQLLIRKLRITIAYQA